MILACDHLNKSFGDRDILRDASFHIQEKEKYALVGVNGVGKTTLLRILMDEERSDGGTITKSREATIGYLPQQMGYHSDKTIYDELYAVRQDIIDQEARLHVLEDKIAAAGGAGAGSASTDGADGAGADSASTDDADGAGSGDASTDGSDETARLLEEYHRLQTDFELKDGYAYQSQVLGVINGLGFGGDAMHQVINTLSGGQKTRVALGRLLLTKPDLLVLDEPTNHLDITSVEWLEGYLSSYPGAVLIVSHDRYFLDRFVEHVWELDQATLRCFNGNYTAYMSQKELLRTTLLHQYEKQQQEIRHQEAVIDKLKSFNREKSIRRAESREKMLDKIERIEKPTDTDPSMKLTLTPAVISGNDVLSIEGLEKRFDDHLLFTDTSFEIKRGEKVAIIGDNGTGKTTLLRMIDGRESITSGQITLGTGVEAGYYDQEHGILHDEKTIFEEIQDDYPNLNNTQIRNTLAAFLFTGDDVFKKIAALSGGEKGRVSLAKLMLSEANLLLLDEPTNHLDMISRELLESALNAYEGTVICVSHDRYFIDRTATRILDLTGGHFYDYKGNYSYYLEKKETVMAGATPATTDKSKATSSAEKTNNADGTSANVSSSKENWLAEKERQAEQRKLERAYNEVEARIEELEGAIAEIDEQLSDPAVGTDLPRLTELTNKRNSLETELEESMNKWEQLAEIINP
ncbi:MAG: ABC-F family ATP-binding cassette domain-containing protein [Eubacterium sp.]|nr:ABC-F family ATP-binding cassette domain-containing protein [Eubacterium sp.]